jgi:hypothetical protein
MSVRYWAPSNPIPSTPEYPAHRADGLAAPATGG